MKKIFSSLFIVLLASIFFGSQAFATIGVGIGAGKITLDEELTPGSIYQLPSLPVLNTGDEPSDYAVSIEYNEVQSQMKPKADWFTFTPKTFHLEPGKSQVVKVSVAVPIKTIPGEYFSYLEAHPVVADVAGVTSIGVAAASKLYFTVAPANFLQGIFYRTKSLVERGTPWTYIGFGIIALIVLIKIFRKFFKFNIAINVKR
jgi:hypothetical protein